MSNKSSVRTPTPRPSWERLRPWHLLVGLPAVAAYALAPWLVSRGLPVPGPLLWLAAVAIDVALAVLVLGRSVEWWNLPGFALFGLCLTLLYQRDRSLLAPLAVHVLANALSIAFLLAR